MHSLAAPARAAMWADVAWLWCICSVRCSVQNPTAHRVSNHSKTKVKKQIVQKFINNNNISSLCDVGCNTGEYSISAFEAGVKNIVGLDLDGYSLNLSYRSLTKKILNMYCNP